MRFEIDRQKYIDTGLVHEKAHPTASLFLYNYTPTCQYSRAWDDVTMMCRGLIVDAATSEVVARPFSKFFNYEEHVERGDTLPDEMPNVYRKLDGSLGILYWLDDKPRVATRGSFTSDQALWATEYIRGLDLTHLNRAYTYLFEIIYPENRIVVSYGELRALVFLAVIETETGRTVPTGSLAPFKTCDVIPFSSYEQLKALNTPNEEGFVLHYPQTDFRVKIKFEDYVKLHKVMTGLSEIGIWEMLKEDRDPFAADIPDEMYGWLQGVVDRLREEYKNIEDEAVRVSREALMVTHIGDKHFDRKNVAEVIKRSKYSGIAFQVYDGKDYSQAIWRMVRPHGSITFRKDINM